MEKPDKVAVMLLVGIFCLISVNVWIIYHTWICNKDKQDAMDSQMQADQMNTELVFHDDTSITNNSSRKLWLRVKVVYDKSRDAGQYRIDSAAVKDGHWIKEDDWYYYRDPVSFRGHTEPLIDRLVYEDKDVMNDSARDFRLQAEAVDETWLSRQPHTGQEAFQLFDELDQAGTDLSL